jgi:hypothetical protein
VSKFSASVTVKLHGGPLDGKSAVSYGAVVGSLIDVNHHNYRVTTVDTIPGWTEMIANATWVDKKSLVPRMVVKPKL